jgi:hypothetical protein
MTNRIEVSEVNNGLVLKVADHYLRVLQTRGLPALINLVLERYHVDNLWYVLADMEHDMDFVPKCDMETYCRLGMSMVMEHARFSVNQGYYVAPSSLVSIQDPLHVEVQGDLVNACETTWI